MHHGPFKRNSYFEGQLLTTKDFQAEQDYHNGKRRLLNRCLVGPGVACGLEVTLKDHLLAVAPGLALDCLGREIVIPEKTEIEFSAEKVPAYLLGHFE